MSPDGILERILYSEDVVSHWLTSGNTNAGL